MSFNIKFQEVNKTQFIDLNKAQINESGHIVLPDGRRFKVELKTAEGEILNKGVGNKEFAQKTLEILKTTSQQFETLDQLTIKNHSVTHFVAGEKKTFEGDEKWKETTSKIFESFTKSFSEKTFNEKKIERREVEQSKIEEKSPENNVSSQQRTRREITDLLGTPNSGGPQKLANKLVDKFSDIPSIKQEIEEFKNKHKNKIDVLNNSGGWIQLKKNLKSDMADPQKDPDEKGMSYEQFRKELNTLVTKLVNQANDKMGIPSMTAGGAGTPGYNSDIDLNMKSASKDRPLTTGDWVVSRAVANLFSVEILGNMPGLTIDTEWYVDRKFLGDQVRSREAKSQIATLDLAMGFVQAKEGFKSDPKQYEEFKKDQLKNSPKEMIPVKKQLFDQAEKFYEKMDVDIAKEFLGQKGENIEGLKGSEITEKLKKYEKEGSFDKDYYNAKVLVQYRAHILLGNECAELEKLIEQGNKKLEGLDPNSNDAKQIQENLDTWIVKHDVLYAMINCTQAEGTMSSSELQTTLDSSAGQIRQRFLENRQKDLAEGLQNISTTPQKRRSLNLGEDSLQPEESKTNSAPSSPRVPRSMQKMKKGAEILGKVDTKAQTEGLGKALTIPTLMLAGQERLAQFSHKIRENHDPIDGGKYCLRVAESNYFALKLLKEQGGDKVPKDIDKQIETASKLYTQARHLEQCKRGFNLNGVVAGKMLKEQLNAIKPNKEVDLSGIEKIFNKDEIGGDWFEGKNKTIMTKELKLEEMVQNLSKEGHISESQSKILLSESNPEKPSNMESTVFESLLNIRAILQAKAGFDATLPESGKLRDLHDKAKLMTKEHYKLTNENEVESFANQVESYTLGVQKIMSNSGVMPKFSTQFSEQFQFAKLWTL